jgi:hypothetical protein
MSGHHSQSHHYPYGRYGDLSEPYPSCRRSHSTEDEYIQMLESECDVLKRRIQDLEQELEDLRRSGHFTQDLD